MAVIINGDTGIDKITDGSIVQADLASGVAGTGPAFSAYMSSSQSVSTGTATKLVFNGEDFDTNSCFDSTTNYRFTPNVAGYYQISAGVFGSVATTARLGIAIYKNGSESGWDFSGGVTSTGGGSATLSNLWYANGSTDYFEAYVVHDNGSSVTMNNLSFLTWFRGFLARAA